MLFDKKGAILVLMFGTLIFIVIGALSGLMLFFLLNCVIVLKINPLFSMIAGGILGGLLFWKEVME